MNLPWIKTIYLYTVSLISLIILVIASIMLINLGLKTFVFTKADNDVFTQYSQSCDSKPIAEQAPDQQQGANEAKPDTDTENPDIAKNSDCNDEKSRHEQEQKQREWRTANRQRDASQAIAMILIATPVFIYHWKLTRKEA